MVRGQKDISGQNPAAVPTEGAAWSTTEAERHYGVTGWGDGYFGVSPDGEVVLHPDGDPGQPAVSLVAVARGLKERGLDMPVLLRFTDVLASRIARVHDSFHTAMLEADYRGGYRGVYPIKVNQQQHVVQEVVNAGRRYHFGLEAGSKAELIAALAYLDDPEALLVCHGYKDEEFIDLALCGQQAGARSVLVLERPCELASVLARARKLGVRPNLGVRAKLSVEVAGHWSGSTGDFGMFGLNAAQMIDVVDELRAAGLLDTLCMLHYHLGSQVSDIKSVRSAAWEAARFYAELVHEGAPMGYLDVGGGLAVDYDGSHTHSVSSSNYGLDEYAADIVEAVAEACGDGQVPQPTLVTEAGRATVAHHAVLLFNVLDTTRLKTEATPGDGGAGENSLLANLREVDQVLREENLQECYHDAVHYRDEVRAAFEHGDLTLRERAVAERSFWSILSRMAALLRRLPRVPEEMGDLETMLADVYHGNFSVFQSLPDAWAIGQLFPIVPLHRLAEKPSRLATLADITCDCDGRIDRFIHRYEERRTLALHPLVDGEEYLLGVFLVGAYQETLGDLHNLLGDTNVASVRLGPDGRAEYVREIGGDSVADVLSYVEYEPRRLAERMRRTAERAVCDGRITAADRKRIMTTYENGLRGYTYFEQTNDAT